MTTISSNSLYGNLKKLVFISIVFLAFILQLTSCKVSQPNFYFQSVKKDTTLNGFQKASLPDLKIKPNDVLSIVISSLNPQEDGIFNSSFLTGSGSGASTGGGYPVSSDGYIYVHHLGKLKVEGMTRKELKAKLEKELPPYLKDPIATVTFSNHHISVLGDATTKLIDMPNERLTIVDVMSEVGAINNSSNNFTADISRIVVIRENDGKKEFKYLNLADHSIFSSPWYYLQPNDIVLLKPNETTLLKERKAEKVRQTVALALTSFSTFLIILDRLIK